LIVAMSDFRLAPKEAGSGGFDLVAESSLPIYQNLNQASVREDLLGGESDVLAGGHLFALRMKPGDDASCRNLFRSTRPRVLGVTPQFIQYFDSANVQHFAWAASDAQSDAEKANPWRLLNRPSEDQNVVPLILDKNTAMYSLQMFGGIGEEKEFVYEDGQSIRFRVVGLLSNSIFQGSLLIGESQFQDRFPRINGYRFFLIQPPPGEGTNVASLLEDRLGDQGFDVTRSRKILEDLLAVQNTYLSAFQSLGALGLLLGGFGLAAVQLRNVLERRAEMALMRAAGFSRRRLAKMVLLENVSLLFGGLATGVLAALVAVLPHMLMGGASIPLGELALMLTLIFLTGLLAGLLAIRATLKAPLVAALRGE
jgi:hypothetical protein